MKCKKGIILAGGTGSRLYPVTMTVNKQLLPVYDKPAIYYPLSTLMLAGITEVLIISDPDAIGAIESLLGSGASYGLTIQYAVQKKPRGLPEAFIIGKEFIADDPVAMVLGDNLFYGQGFSSTLMTISKSILDNHIFLYSVKDPSRYGVAKINVNNEIDDIVEKPEKFISQWAVTGLYFFPSGVSERAEKLNPSERGELEITDLIRSYLKEKKLLTHKLGRGNVWLDIGTPDSLLEAANFVEMIQNRQNFLIASPEEIAWRMNLIDKKDCETLVKKMPDSSYRKSLELALMI